MQNELLLSAIARKGSDAKDMSPAGCALEEFLKKMEELKLFTQSYAIGRGYTHMVTLPWPITEDKQRYGEAVHINVPTSGDHPANDAAKKIKVLVESISATYNVKGKCTSPFMTTGGMNVVLVGFE